MIIIVEGMDRAGKDTLINNLRSVIKTPRITVLHEGKPPKGVDQQEWSENHYLHFMAALVDHADSGSTVICNRSHLGETVYGPMFRGINADHIWELEKQFVNDINGDYCFSDVFLIVLVDDPKNLAARADGNSNEETIEQIVLVKTKFEEAFDKSAIPSKRLINIAGMTTDQVFVSVRNFIGL